MRFFSALYNSLYNFKWLQNQKNNFLSAWSYFFLLIFLVSGLSAIEFGYTLSGFLPEVKKEVTNWPDFQVQVTDGELKVTGPQQPLSGKVNGTKFVLDTTSDTYLDIKKMVDQDKAPVVLLDRNQISFFDESSDQLDVQSFKGLENLDFNKAIILAGIDKVSSAQVIIILSVFALIGLMFFFGMMFLSSVSIFSLTLYFLMRNNRYKLSFKNIFSIGMFAVTAPFLLAQISGFFGLSALLSLACALLFFKVVYSDKNRGVV